jgi:hypothetical protein
MNFIMSITVEQTRELFFWTNMTIVDLLPYCMHRNSRTAVDISKHFRDGGSFPELFEIERGDPLVDVIVLFNAEPFSLTCSRKNRRWYSEIYAKAFDGYSMYFNKKNERTGALFEGRFKAKHADTDEYLKYLFAYIHLNPVKIIDSKWKEEGIKDRDYAADI